jgi:D-sedoheptulose 7-phosphate isomerase
VSSAEEIFHDLLVSYPPLEQCVADIAAASDALVRCFRSGGKLLLCGNGGSAADTEHIAAELLKEFRQRRAVESPPEASLSRELRDHLQGALPAIPLPSFVAPLTAFANDCFPEYAFAQLVFALGRQGDLLLSLSTSGNSANVLRANETAKALGLGVIGLSGEDGGKMASGCDICIRVPERETYRIQELHLPVYHALCAMVESIIFGCG